MNTRFDPRPDIDYDHGYWVDLLKYAHTHNRSLWGLLHGFRCCGCRITEGSNKVLRFDFEEVFKELGIDEISFKEKWIAPNRMGITRLLRRAII